MLQVGMVRHQGSGAVAVAGPGGVAMVSGEWAALALDVVNGRADPAELVRAAQHQGSALFLLDLLRASPLVTVLGHATLRAWAWESDGPSDPSRNLVGWELDPLVWAALDVTWVGDGGGSGAWLPLWSGAASAGSLRIGYPGKLSVPVAPVIPAPVIAVPMISAPAPSGPVAPLPPQSPAPMVQPAPAPVPVVAPAPVLPPPVDLPVDLPLPPAPVVAPVAESVVPESVAPAAEAPPTPELVGSPIDVPPPAVDPQPVPEPAPEPAGESASTQPVWVPGEPSPVDDRTIPGRSVAPVPVAEPLAEPEPVPDVPAPAPPLIPSPSQDHPWMSQPAAGMFVPPSPASEPNPEAFEETMSVAQLENLRRAKADATASPGERRAFLIYAGTTPVALDRDIVLGRDPDPQALIGRPPAMTLRLPSPASEISRSHAAVFVRGEGAADVVDLGSSNGTTLRRATGEQFALVPMAAIPLLDGDGIDLGDGVIVEFRIRQQEA